MFTVCPKCALTLVVTATDLKVGQGYVRCGRCSNVFNALVAITEERHGTPAPQATAAPPPSPPPPEPDSEEIEFELEPEPEPEPEPESPAEDVSDEALEFNANATDLNAVFVEPRPGPHDVASGTFETIVLEAGESPPESEDSPTLPREGSMLDLAGADAANDRSADAPQAANDPALPAGEPADSRSGGFDRSRIETPRARAPAAPPTASPRHSPPPSVAQEIEAWKAGQALEAEAEGDLDLIESATDVPAPRPSRRPLVLWSAGVAAFALLLVLQLVHHNRRDLALDPRFGAPLTRIYGALGLTLVPRWDLARYDVRQLGASAEAAPGGESVLTVRASVQNGAENPQPLPLLRVTVQDRFGNRIASRDIAPAAYAPRGQGGASALLDAGQRVDAEIRLADPGPNAVGFELDACLVGEGGRIACANDQRR
jgi:predicted Zn finger-like uncharacterized protein